jgi:general secretion pathway protein D
MIKTKKVSIIIIITLFVLTASVSAGPQDRIQNMNFNNASVVDVLRAIAEVADVNLITDSEVSGNITVNLKDITFEKALSLITQTRSLAYKWDEDTVVVAPPERLESIYTDIETEFVKVESRDFDNIGTIVKEIFPETQITLDTARQQFILKGQNDRIAEIKEMITRLDKSKTSAEIESEERVRDFEAKEIDIYSESYKVLNSELADLQDKLVTVNPGLEIKVNPLTEIITISGEKGKVIEALSMAEAYDSSLEPETRNIRVDYVDTEQITEIVGKFYPEIKIHVNPKRKEIIINGAKNKLDNVVNLIKEINIPKYQVMIEIRVEEIGADLSREIGINNLENFSTIEFEKDSDGDIDGINYTWPDLFKLLDNNSNSVTLANPRLMTLNGEEASMSILDEEPYPVREINEDGSSSITYEYAEAGVKVLFTPWITEGGEVELSIAPEVSNFTRINPDSQVPPATSTRSIKTKLRLQDGEMFAIGGLIQTEKNGSVTKIPLLGDIPIIGELFKSRLDENDRTELIIFVRPKILEYGEGINNSEHLISADLDLNQDSKNEIDDSKISNEHEEIKNENEVKVEEDQTNSKTKDEILEEYKNKPKKEFQELTPDELDEILN